MAFTVSGLSAFTDKATELLTKKTLLSNDLARYSFEDDVQYKKYINVATVQLYPQAGTCSLTTTGGTTFTQVELTVVPVAYNPSYCFEDLYQKAIKIDRQSLAKGMEDNAWMTILTDEHVTKIAKDVENTLWAGATATGSLYDGWATKAFAATDRAMIDGSLTAYTIANFTASSGITIIDDVIQGVCDKVVATENLWAAVEAGDYITIHVSPVIYNVYKKYQIANNLFRDADKNLAVKEMWVSGYEGQISIKEEAALNDSTTSNKPKMIATYDKNLYIAASMIDNVTAPKGRWIFDEVTDLIWFKANMRVGAQIAFTDLVVTNY